VGRDFGLNFISRQWGSSLVWEKKNENIFVHESIKPGQ
jgi:hypothetical protein